MQDARCLLNDVSLQLLDFRDWGTTSLFLKICISIFKVYNENTSTVVLIYCTCSCLPAIQITFLCEPLKLGNINIHHGYQLKKTLLSLY